MQYQLKNLKIMFSKEVMRNKEIKIIKWLICIICPILAMGLVYFIGAFTESFIPLKEWSSLTRNSTGVLMLAAYILSFAFIYIEIDQ